LKKVRINEEDETSNDGTLFKLLNITGPERDAPLNFTNILSRITSPAGPKVSKQLLLLLLLFYNLWFWVAYIRSLIDKLQDKRQGLNIKKSDSIS
jgi:hypothetical protein